MARGLPEGYKSASELLKEFRTKHPNGTIKTEVIVSAGDFAVVTATVSNGTLTATGIADGDLQEGKGSSKAESAAIRRALVHLGFESVESDDDQDDEKEEKPKAKRFERSEGKRKADDDDSDEESDDEDDSDNDAKEKPRSRFTKRNEESDGSEDDDDEQDEKPKEGRSRFERGSRFTRN
jgi:hypothetical protein